MAFSMLKPSLKGFEAKVHSHQLILLLEHMMLLHDVQRRHEATGLARSGKSENCRLHGDDNFGDGAREFWMNIWQGGGV
jgi:hypothetical protein